MTEIDLTMIEYEGRKYGAAQVIVTIGGSPVDAMALYADPDKRILLDGKAAKNWLIERGLAEPLADELMLKADLIVI